MIRPFGWKIVRAETQSLNPWAHSWLKLTLGLPAKEQSKLSPIFFLTFIFFLSFQQNQLSSLTHSTTGIITRADAMEVVTSHLFSSSKALHCFQLTTELHLKKYIGARTPYKHEAQVNSVENSTNKEN